ncbi:hypothetical protein VTL71DRAFT_15257 [Oculimacula yallundae]|uniref:Uncharacterized protein n=1 Tax=Oculimacula yallundae TaxID=86028 RepID=A0ABR4CG26_9HELO
MKLPFPPEIEGRGRVQSSPVLDGSPFLSYLTSLHRPFIHLSFSLSHHLLFHYLIHSPPPAYASFNLSLLNIP